MNVLPIHAIATPAVTITVDLTHVHVIMDIQEMELRVQVRKEFKKQGFKRTVAVTLKTKRAILWGSGGLAV